LAALTIACSSACSSAPDPTVGATKDDTTASTKENLFASSGDLWGENAVINLCWNFADWETEKGWVEDAVTSWSNSVKVSFAFWPDCDHSPSGAIQLNEHDRDANNGPATGPGLGKGAQWVDLDFIFANWDPSCMSNREYCIRAIASHEFGHVLGFAHEQNEAQTPEWCKELKKPQGNNGDLYLTRWDQRSIMDYCSPQWDGAGDVAGMLSPLDRWGAQKVYGRKGIGAVLWSQNDPVYGLQVGASQVLDLYGTLGHIVGWQNFTTFSSPPELPLDASIVAINDFNGDYDSDFVWKSGTSYGVVLTRDGVPHGSYPLGTAAAGWDIVATGDFNGDGYGDLLWHNSATGGLHVWRLDDSNKVLSYDDLVDQSSLDWQVQGAGDCNNDGVTDIMWRQKSTGAVGVWTMAADLPPAQGKQGAIRAASMSTISGALSSDWVIKGVGDFDGDGNSDILWLNTATRALGIWRMVNCQPQAYWSPDTVSSDLQIEGVGDIDNDGKDDILLRNTTDGSVWVWMTTTAGDFIGTKVAIVQDQTLRNWQIAGASKELHGVNR
jgi:hypothetical protein